MPESYLPALMEELRSHGVSDHDMWLDDTGKHNKLRFRWSGGTLTHIFPKTPSDSRHGVLNSLCDLRRQMGVRRVIRKAGDVKARRPVAPPKPEEPIAPSDPEPEVYKCPRMSLADIAFLLS